MSQVAGLANIPLTVVALASKGVAGLSYLFGQNDLGENVDDFYYNVVDTQSELTGKANAESVITNNINNEGIKTIGNVSNTVSNMATSALMQLTFGVPGSLVQALSVGGNSAQEVLEENPDNIMQATTTGILKGTLSHKIESLFGGNILSRGSISDYADDFIYNVFKTNKGREVANFIFNVGGENVEEFLEDSGDYLVDYLVNDKDLPTMKEYWNNVGETAKITTLSTIAMQLLGLGGESFSQKEPNIITRKTQEIINKNKLTIQDKPEIMSNLDKGEFYISNFNQDGDIINIQRVQGKKIINPNNNVHIDPVIIKNNQTGYYNVIDNNTGLLLDSSPYQTLIEAQYKFDHKLIDLDNSSINNINQKIMQASLAISQKTNEIYLQAENEISNDNNNVINTPQNGINNVKTYTNVDNNTNIDAGTYTNIDNNINPGTYTNLDTDTNTNTKTYTNIDTNNGLNEVSKLVTQIQDNSIYNSNKVSQAFRIVTKNIPNVELQIDNDSSYLNSLDKDGNVIYQQKLSGRPYRGSEIKDIINNAINNADLSNIRNAENIQANTTNMSDRTFENISNKNVLPYQEEHQELQPEIQEMAMRFIDDLANTTKGKRYKVGDSWTGQKRSTTRELAYIKDNTNASWEEIGQALGDISNNKGNYTLAKKIEIVLDDALTNGYRNIYGQNIKPNESYLNKKSNIENIQDSKSNNSSANEIEFDREMLFGEKEVRKKNTTQAKQNGFRGISNNEAANYVPEKGNAVVGENKNTSNLSDEEVRNIVKYNPDGREISDSNYVDFLVERYKDNKNISGVITDTRYVESIENKIKKDKISDLYEKIKDKEFKITKELRDENGELQNVDLNLVITKKGLNESFNKGFSNEKYAIVPYLDEIIKTSQDGTIRAETKMRSNIMQWYYLYNTAKINGQLYAVKVDIKKTPQGDRFYVHRVNLVHKDGTANQIPAVGNGTIKINTVPSTNTSISQNKQSVKNSTNVTNKSMQNNKNNTLKAINSLNDIKAKYKNQIEQLNIFENKDNTISINNIIVKQNLRNKGIGQSILKDIINYADKTNKTVTLTPTSEYLTKNKLINWYKRNGFVENKGKNTDFSISDTMYRLPKNNMQNNQNVKDNGIRAERTSTTTEYDNQGNKLSKAQSDFFKDSKVRDENGKLLVMYHGTEANVGIPSEFWFTIFDIDKSGNHGNMLGDGFYFTSNIEHAQQYAHLKGNIYETYLNITKPLELKHFSTGELSYAIRKINPYIEADIYKRDGTIDGYKVRRYLLDNGYDGIHSGNTYVAFDSNQIKNITNNSPTSNPDIRYERTNTTSQPYDARKYEKNDDFVNYLKDNNYLKNLMEVDNQQGETYAHNFERRIEQEIRNVESTGAFDNSIPITKLSDIDKMVKDFLGTQMQKGHFRQRARGIYNSKTDTIRVKEYKDMDNVLHEMGHALDLGNRIKIDKETIATELLDAIKKHGGYENEARSIQLDEGFAEIVKEYAINPVQTKLDYPQTYAVLEAERQQNVKFNTFMGNLQTQLYNYIHQNPENRVLSNLSIGEQTDKPPVTIKSIEENVVRWVWDRDISIKSMANELAKASGKKLTPSQNVYLLTRLASGVNNKAISMISKGYIDLNGNRLMPGLNKLGEILGNDPQRWNDLRAFLVAKRDLEYKAKSLKSGIRTIDSKAVVEKFYNDTQIQEAAQVVYDTLDGVLQYAVDNGLITQENAKSLRESNAFYVPFQRVIEGRGNQIGRRGSVSEIIHRRTGSELDIKDVLENIVANSANIIQQVENNTILRTLAEQGEAAGMKNSIFEQIPPPMKKIGTEQLATWEKELKKQGVDTSKLDLEKTIDIFVPNTNIISEKDGSHIASFFDRDGKRKYLQFYKESTDIFNALMGMDKNANSSFLKIMRAANMPLRYGATMANVGFAIPNMISDTVQATIYSEAGFVPVVDNILGVLDVLGATNKSVRNFLNKYAPGYAEKINRLYDIYQQTGASSSTRMSQYRKSTQEIMNDIYGTKSSEVLGIKESFKPLKRLMDLLTYIPELSESSTRFRVFERNYNAALNKGMSETDARIQAAIESRDATQDFGRTGTVMREINQLIPFSAARVGSVYTFTEKIKANPKRTVARVAILATVAMAIKAIGYDDDEIEELNQRKKDDNFVVKIGDTIVTIKKPQGILRSIINLVEYVQDLATGHIEEGKEWDRLGNWLNNAIMDNLPADEPGGLVPNAFAPLIENAINKDFYYNTDIVKSYDLDLPEEEQYYDYTSQLAIWLGKIFHQSPAKIDNLISGYFGSLGTQFTNIIDWISGKLGISVEEPAMGAEDNAIGKRFVVNVNENSASVDEIYSREKDLTKKLNGGTITEEENTELERLKDGISKLSALNKQIKTIKQDLTMSGEEKADKIKPLQEQKVDVARQALGKDPIYTENTDDLEALEFYPTRSTLSYNGLTLDLTEEMKQEYMNTANDLYKQYEKQGLYSEEYLEKLKTKCKEAAKKTLIQKYRNQLK